MKTLQLLVLILFATISIDAQTVYITKTGAKYHTGSCRYLSKSKISISLADAQKKGFGACSVCKPPTSVTSTSTKSKQAYITTFVDGTDVGKVNLWNHKTERNNIVTSCTNQQKVTILESDDNYVKLKTADGKVGWCMKGFINKDK